MTSEKRDGREDRTGPGVCANEGCERPAEGLYCDACALEWSLFHREERESGPARERRTG